MKRFFRVTDAISQNETSMLLNNGSMYIIVKDGAQSEIIMKDPDAVEIEKSELVDAITLFLTELKDI